MAGSERRHPRRTIAVLVAMAGLSAMVSADRTNARQAEKLPDLRIASARGNPEMARPHSSFDFRTKIVNAGQGDAPRSHNGYALSRDGKINSQFPIVRLLGRPRVPPLDPGGKARVSWDVRIPRGTPPGRYFVLACADVVDGTRESRERNNCTASPKRVTIITRSGHRF
jgi:hypothetical protein